MFDTPGSRLRSALSARPVVPFVGVYDAFSAVLAARRFDALFVSGFGFAASHYGLPDIGFIAWTDMVDFVRRIRAVVPDAHLLVDIDDGYVDVETACHVVRQLERAGASGVVLEDQQRPRRCGHFDGKQILPLPDYLAKLERVLEVRQDLLVVARTDATDPADVLTRTEAFAAAGADVVLADGLRDLAMLGRIRAAAGAPVAFNQIAGGKSPRASLSELGEYGAKVVIYSTPCLFPAQQAIEQALDDLSRADGLLPDPDSATIGVAACTAVLRTGVETFSRSR